jgi:hypothetical protein
MYSLQTFIPLLFVERVSIKKFSIIISLITMDITMLSKGEVSRKEPETAFEKIFIICLKMYRKLQSIQRLLVNIKCVQC